MFSIEKHIRIKEIFHMNHIQCLIQFQSFHIRFTVFQIVNGDFDIEFSSRPSELGESNNNSNSFKTLHHLIIVGERGEACSQTRRCYNRRPYERWPLRTGCYRIRVIKFILY